MSLLGDIISVIGGAVALVAAAAWLAKMLIQHWLNEDIETHRSSLRKDVESHKSQMQQNVAMTLQEAKYEFENELVLRKGEIDVFRDELKNWNESESEREKRLRGQAMKWANPILSAIRDLKSRIDEILLHQGFWALSSSSSGAPHGWSANYNYYMVSTLYYFAQYFCWTRMLQQKISAELFVSNSDLDDFQKLMTRVSNSLERFPFTDELEETTGNESQEIDSKAIPKDIQLFSLQQRAIGESLILDDENGERIMSYKEFVDNWVNQDNIKFRRHMDPLESFLKEIKPEDDLRWSRLFEMAQQLEDFETTCASVLRPDQRRKYA